MKPIALSQGQVAFVDDGVYEELDKSNWFATWDQRANAYYAVRSSVTKENRMHRAVIGAPNGVYVDHIDGNTLNNTYVNLRLVTSRQNSQNIHRTQSSIYPGVCWHKKSKKWYARIHFNGNISLGFYTNEREAFNAYLAACVKHGFSIDQMLEKFGGTKR